MPFLAYVYHGASLMLTLSAIFLAVRAIRLSALPPLWKDVSITLTVPCLQFLATLAWFYAGVWLAGE